MKLAAFFAVATLLMFHSAEAAPTPDNPHPLPDDLVLPMPGGRSMVFRPVFIGAGAGPLAVREFKVGDRAAGGFQEHPTAVALGGAFQQERDGNADWLFYLGKYEVSEAQYYAVMEPEREVEGNFPVRDVSWFDASEFMHRYNTWLFKNARDQLPSQGEMPGFLRLPGEIEWEFAARGGVAVNENQFDRRHPYGGDLVHHEWFSGPESSHNKVRETGLLRPNPLGLHDMLGNVSEMTGSQYHLEYYLGRQGGMVTRGGDVFTSRTQIRSSLRNEQPLYDGEFQPARHPTVGFRPAIGSVIYDGRNTAGEMESAWEEYRKTRRQPVLPADSLAPASATASQRIAEIQALLDRLGQSMGQDSGEASDQIGLLRAALSDVESTVARAEHDSAGGWVRIAANAAFVLSRELSKIRKSEMLLEIIRESASPDQLREDEERHGKLLENIEQAWTRYGDAIRQLQKSGPQAVEEQFDAFEKHVAGLDIPQQAELIAVARSHYLQYRESNRVDLDQWGDDLKGVWAPAGD